MSCCNNNNNCNTSDSNKRKPLNDNGNAHEANNVQQEQSKKQALTMESDSKSSKPSDIAESVQRYYGRVLQSTKDLKTSACCTSQAPPLVIRNIIKSIPDEIISRYYGCGNTIPFGVEGLHVLDLGSGSGRDCYIAAALVGEKGSVTGVDFTDEQLEIARNHIQTYTNTLKYSKPNLKFVKGYIELLEEAGIARESIDLIISNCVVNLSPNKPKVLQGAYASLKKGGEFYFSDVYCDRRLPDSVRQHEVLWGECIAGALYIEDFRRLCHQVGFTDPRQVSKSEIVVQDDELKRVVGNAKFYSITYRLFKLDNLETLCEDYGQVAIYRGTIPELPHAYQLDDHHLFETNKPVLVCGNTASMVGESWLAKHFTIIGDRSVHYGLFPCSPPVNSSASASSSSGGGCC